MSPQPPRPTAERAPTLFVGGPLHGTEQVLAPGTTKVTRDRCAYTLHTFDAVRPDRVHTRAVMAPAHWTRGEVYEHLGHALIERWVTGDDH